LTELSEIIKVAPERIVSKIAEKLPAHMVSQNSPVGMFDSGVGGLTVLREVMRVLPNESVIYFADTARVPYGSRPREEIIKINHEIIDYMIEDGVKLIVMACGTSSSIAYPVVVDEYKLPIISLIPAGSREAVKSTRSGRIGLIATIGTVESGAFQKEIKAIRPDAEVFAQACPLFVPLIEGGFAENADTKVVAREYLKPLIERKIDALILGCTHYPHLRRMIQDIVGDDVTLVDPGLEMVRDVKDILTKRNRLTNNKGKADYTYIATGSVPQFEEIGSKLLGKPISGTRKVTFIAKRGSIE
jgi:glutamate racemase